MASWLDEQPAFRDGSGPIAFTDLLVGPLAGGNLAHDLRLLPPAPSCRLVRSAAAGGWLVVNVPPGSEATPVGDCAAAIPSFELGDTVQVFEVPEPETAPSE